MISRDAKVERATRRLAATWATFIKDTDGADATDDDRLVRRWADNPFPWWNIAIVPGGVSSAADLRASLADAARYIRSKRHAGSIRVADELLALLGADRADALAALGLAEGGAMTEMVGSVSGMRLREPGSATFERVSDDRALRALADINGEAAGLPSEVARAGIATAPETWMKSAYSYLAYEDGELVSVASVLPHDGRLYVGLVATVPAARRRGLASSTTSHALKQAHRDTGIDRTDLHASDMGIPVYHALGYRSTVAFRSLRLADRDRP